MMEVNSVEDTRYALYFEDMPNPRGRTYIVLEAIIRDLGAVAVLLSLAWANERQPLTVLTIAIINALVIGAQIAHVVFYHKAIGKDKTTEEYKEYDLWRKICRAAYAAQDIEILAIGVAVFLIRLLNP